MITGATDVTLGRNDRDVEFCMDLGLVAWDGSLVVANAIYREVIARYLNQNYQDNIPKPEFRWQTDHGTLDMDALLDESKTKIGYELSFTRYFYKPQPLRTLDEIKPDILAVGKESEGLLEMIMGATS